MPYRPKDIYRGRRKFHVPLTIFLFVLAGLFIGAVVLFYALQQYIVYDQSGVTLQLPFMQTEAPVTQEETEPTPAFEPIAVQVIYEEPDFSDLDLDRWEDLAPTQARFIPYSDAVSDTKLSAAISNAESGGYSGVVLQLKDKSGRLAWASACELAAAYGTAGTMDYTETVEAIHEKGMTAAAQISCCADELMATRNWPATLQITAGNPYRDSDGTYWLDPYNRSIRSYLIDLTRELIAMGFDEVILADLYHPISESAFMYSVTLQAGASPVTAVCQMGRRISEAAGDAGVPVSVLISADSMRNGQYIETGQDLSVFWKLFARVYCPTDYWTAAEDMALATASMTEGSADIRFVPVSEMIPEDMASYEVR